MEFCGKIKIVCEESYAESVWCKQLLAGLLKEIKKRRVSYEKLFNVDEIVREDNVYIIGMSVLWIEKNIKKCNDAGCVPVLLSNQSNRNAKGHYHLICPDIGGASEKLNLLCENAGRTRIALYGANRNSDLDADRTESFLKLVRGMENIYPNTGNLEACFQAFLPHAGHYDVVICVNGYAAVSLVKKIEKERPEILGHLVIVSCEEVLRHSKYSRWISFIDLKLESYGAIAMAVAEMSFNKDDIAAITVEIDCDVCEIPKKDKESHSMEIGKGKSRIFEDPEIICMARIEQLMRDADDMDHHIIAMLLENAKYSEIADSCYMTEGNVKYRVKKYMSICDCKTKKELLELLQEYLQ